MALKLHALEKNILKYRALKMVLLLHEMESLRKLIIGSIRSTDKFRGAIDGPPKELPEGAKNPLGKALAILVEKGILSEEESSDIQEINEMRNTIGHALHSLVEDISSPDMQLAQNKAYDYGAVDRIERYRRKVEKGIAESYVMVLSLSGVSFEQAELTYKEELVRLRNRINRQYDERFGEDA